MKNFSFVAYSSRELVKRANLHLTPCPRLDCQKAKPKIGLFAVIQHYFLLSTEIKFPELGWFNPWNGYQYRLTKNLGNWSSVRSECQSYGADLAAFGMRNFNTRR